MSETLSFEDRFSLHRMQCNMGRPAVALGNDFWNKHPSPRQLALMRDALVMFPVEPRDDNWIRERIVSMNYAGIELRIIAFDEMIAWDALPNAADIDEFIATHETIDLDSVRQFTQLTMDRMKHRRMSRVEKRTPTKPRGYQSSPWLDKRKRS